MPIPKPNTGEEKDAFIERCMGNETIADEYPDDAQRAAVCQTAWTEAAETAADAARMARGEFPVEIFAVGRWNGMTFTHDDINDFAKNFEELQAVQKVPLKLGHNDEQPFTDGQPSLGWVSRLTAKAGKLVATFVDVPERVRRAIKTGRYKRVSIEALFDVKYKGRTYRNVLDAVALLGADIPAVNTLADLDALMIRDSLESGRHAAFSAVTGDIQSTSEDTDMSDTELKAKNAVLEAEVTAYKEKLTKAAETEVSLRDENARLRAEKDARETADLHSARMKKRTDLVAKLDKGVEEFKITPAIRDKYIKEAEANEDAIDIVSFAVDKLMESIESNPDFYSREQSLQKGKGGREEEGQAADSVVLKRTNEYMEKHGEKNFSIAKLAVLKADPKLAEAYVNQTTMGGEA